MARGTIKQRIALEGGDAIKKELLELGRAGEVVWAKLNALSKKAPVPSGFQRSLETIRKSFSDLSKFGGQVGDSFARVRRGFDDLGNAAQRMTTRVSLISTVVTGAVVGLGALAKSAADSADSLLENAERAGMSAQAFQRLSAVASLSGAGPEDLARGLLALNKQLAEATGKAKDFTGAFAPMKDAAQRIKEGFGEGGVSVTRFMLKAEEATTSFTKALRELGITNLDTFKALPQEEKLIGIADGMAKITDETKRTTVVAQLFGKAGLTMLPFLSQGGEGIRKLIERLKALGLELDETALKSLAGLSDEFGVLGIAATLLKNKLVAAFAPDLIRGSNALLDFIAKNKIAINDFIRFIATEAVGIVRDFYRAVTGEGQVERPWVQEWTNSIRAFGEAVRGAVDKIIVPAFTLLMATLDKVAAALNFVFGTELTGRELGIVLLIAQITGALGLLIPFVTAASTVFSVVLIPAILRTMAAITALSGPIGLAAIALAALAVEIVKNWDAIRTGFDSVFSPEQEERARTFWENVGRGAGIVVSAVQAALADLRTVFSGVFDGIAAAAQAAWQAIIAGATAIGTAVESALTGAIGVVRSLWDGLTNYITNSVASIVAAIQSVINAIARAISAAAALVGIGGGGGGEAPAFASGGYVRGPGTARSDSIPAWLSNGEFVVQARAVKKYGRALLAALNEGRLKLPKLAGGGAIAPKIKLGLPAYAMGGLADAMRSGLNIRTPRFPSGAAGGLGQSIFLTLDGQTVGPMIARADVSQDLIRLARRRQVTSGGRKPPWYGG